MPAEFKDYYEILGVRREASPEEITKAFRKLARQHHPDVAKNKKQAEERFKEINEAHEVLSDPEKRRRYDELGADWKQGARFGPSAGWQETAGRTRYHRADGRGFDYQFGGTGFSDFFEQFFGSRVGGRGDVGEGGGAFGEEDSSRGRDTEADILVTLEEVANGSIRAVTVQRPTACNVCNGSGRRGRMVCPQCNGSGQTTTRETYQVKIPTGVREGQRLRLAGRGEQGAGRAPAGDLYLRVRLAKHPDFRVEEDRLYYDLDLAPWEAVLGTTVSVPTFAGEVQIKIPPGTQSGQQLRVRGRGLPRHGADRDDLFVVTRVRVPERISENERSLWERLARDSRFHPRE